MDGVTETSVMGGTDLGYIMSIYYYVSVDILTKAAKELGENDDFNRYTEQKEKIYNAILSQFFAPNGKLAVNTQTAYILSLYYNIYRNKEDILNGYKERLRLDAYKLKTGFTGTPLILLTLFDNGMDDQAYRFLYHEKFPGWIYAINLGATTIWERWNSLLANGTISGISMNSFNHYAYGSVCEAIYSRIVGLKNLSPGWKKVLIQPHLNFRLKQVNFSYNSVRGKFVVSWKYDEEKFYINITIPYGVEATIILPDIVEYNVTHGEYKYACYIDEKIIAPFSIDSPIFEILENENATKVLKDLLPSIYNDAIGEGADTPYRTIREVVTQPFSGISEEIMNQCQEELSKIKVLNYTSPDIPTDSPIEPTDDEHSQSMSMKFNQLVLCLIILFYL